MTDTAIIAASLTAERNYSHNPDDVIDASDAVGAWGNTKESTTELSDLSGNSNVAEIHGAMPTEGFIQGRRFDGIDDYLDCGNDSSLGPSSQLTISSLILLYEPPTKYDGIVTKRSLDGLNGYSFITDRTETKIIALLKIGGVSKINTSAIFSLNQLHNVVMTYDNSELISYVDTIPNTPTQVTGNIGITDVSCSIGNNMLVDAHIKGIVLFTYICNYAQTPTEIQSFFNTLACLPFWSVNYTDYPNNVTEYTDNLPYSSSIISSGTFKIDDDKLQCVSAGTITYSASYEFDGSEYIKVEIDGVEYAGTGTITQGNTTVSITQGSNKVTITMGTADTIDKVRIQFREEV